MPASSYRHTQTAPLCLLLYGFAIYVFALAWFLRNEPGFVPYAVLLVGLVMLILAAAMHHLTVEDEVDQLAVRFGPLPLFQTRIQYDDMREVEVGRTTILEGWGIHVSLRGGWVWNIWGRDCVVIRRRRGTIRVGTDDPQGLAEFLEGRISR